MTLSRTMIGHHKDVCEYGYVHSQCRCPSPEKREVTVRCNLLDQHAPKASLSSIASLKHSSLEASGTVLLGTNLMLSYERRDSLARAAYHLLACGDDHDFVVLMSNQPMPALLGDRETIDCLRLAGLMFSKSIRLVE